MSSLIQGDYDIHPTRRVADIGIGFGGGGLVNSWFSAIGDDLTDGPFDGRTGTFSRTVDNDGARTAINTVAVNGDYNHIYGASVYKRNFEPNFYSRFKLNSTLNYRVFLGLTNLDPATMSNSSMGVGTSPAGYYCGFWKDISDGNFKFIRNNNTTTATVQSLGAADTNVHDMYMWLKKSGGGDVVIFQLDNGTRYEVSTNIPSATQNMMYMCVIRSLISSIRTIEIGKIHIDCLY